VLGSFIVVIGAGAIIATTAALAPHGTTTSFHDALGIARGLSRHVGHGSGALFAVLLLNSSVIGAAAVTLASSYALGDFSSNSLSASLNSRLRDAKGFFGAFAALLAVAGTVALIPHAPLGLITLAVQAICGLMLPSTTINVLLLCNDRELMGPWVNTKWLNVVAVTIVSTLVVLSITMMVSTLFTGVNVVALLSTLFAVAGVCLVVGLAVGLRRQAPATPFAGDRRDWRTPRLALLSPPPASRARRILMRAQFTYLSVAGALLVVRIVQLATS
jgi:hypothetical protein